VDSCGGALDGEGATFGPPSGLSGGATRGIPTIGGKREFREDTLRRFPLGVEVASGFRRGTSWRPLSSAEIGHYEALRGGRHWHSKAVSHEGEAYWSSLGVLSI